MAFKTDGFLSPTMAGFTATLRQVPAYNFWFGFSETLNHLGLEMLEDHETPTDDNQRLCISVLFVRAHHSLQAAIILIERGMLSDARALLRSAVEGSIALNALANDPGFVDQIIEAHLYNQRKMVNVILGTPEYRTLHSPEEIEQMKVTIQEVGNKEAAAGHQFRDIQWSVVGQKHCKDLYELVYRSLSNDGTHTNVNAIHRFLEFEGNSTDLTGFRFGPSNVDMVAVIRMACLMFLWAADAFARTYNEKFRPRILAAFQVIETHPHDEPVDVRVVVRFDE